MELREIQGLVYRTHLEKGWERDPSCEGKGKPELPPCTVGSEPFGVDADRVAALIALAHSELSEALEELRKGPGHYSLRFEKDSRGIDKPEGFDVELADAIIRILNICSSLGLDIQRALMVKNEYNMTRDPRHGGRAI